MVSVQCVGIPLRLTVHPLYVLASGPTPNGGRSGVVKIGSGARKAKLGARETLWRKRKTRRTSHRIRSFPRTSRLTQAHILAEALPNMLRYDEQTVVIKFGGHAMGDQALSDAFAKDIVYLKQSGVNPIVVHGGGPQIANMLKKLEIKSDFVNGLQGHRQADRGSRRDGALRPHQQEIVLGHQPAGRQGGRHLGKDANLMIARKITEMPDPESNIMKAVDIGFVGDPLQVNPHIVDVISKSDLIPVIAPVGVSREGETLNINADTFASALAARMQAKRLLLLTDVEGVLDKDGNLIADLTIEQAQDLIRNGTITGGMIPKIEGCIEVVEVRRRSCGHHQRQGPAQRAARASDRSRRRHARRAGASRSPRGANGRAAAQARFASGPVALRRRPGDRAARL